MGGGIKSLAKKENGSGTNGDQPKPKQEQDVNGNAQVGRESDQTTLG